MRAFEQLHVVSDLHLGGRAGRQIFDQHGPLASLVDELRGRSVDGLGLVLNGDVVDFLAEPGASYLDPRGAADKLERIMKDEAFRPAWDALGRFVAADGRELVFVLGNHDVELALPAVRDLLLQKLSGGEPTRRGRISFSFEGAGFTCRVGGALVHCTHGNEVDDWNFVDVRQLVEVMRAVNRGQPPREWDPNAGTKLVIDVMNDVKARYPFVDLLKPETAAVPAVLLAMDESIGQRLLKLAPVLLRLAATSAGRRGGLLGGSELVEARQGDVALQLLLGGAAAADFRDPAASAPDVSEDELLRRVEERFARGEDPVSSTAREGTLGLPGVILDRFLRRDPAESLRDALQRWLREDRSFDHATPDSTSCALDRDVGKDVRVIVAGHTHLQRALRRSGGQGAYFNSGTWINLVRLREDVLASPEAFAPAFAAMRKGTMDALEGGGLIERRPTVVSIERENGRVFGELRYARTDPARLEPVPDSRQEA